MIKWVVKTGMYLWFCATACSLQFIDLYAQNNKQHDSLSVTTPMDTSPRMDTAIVQKEFSDTLNLVADTSAVDSYSTAFQDTDVYGDSLPTPMDSNRVAPPGHELLALSSKRNKFAYFDTTHSIDRIIHQTAFDVGEKLTFIIRYGPIVAGEATMEIPKITKITGNECFHITTTARSNRFFSAFFKVEDRVESFMDRDGLFTWRYEKHLREGKYRADQYVEYDYAKRLAITDKKDTLRIPPCVQDILTSFYYVRTLSMEVGKSVYIDNHADRKLYPLEIKIHHKERVNIRAGVFDCIVIEPMLRSDAIFKQRGRLLIWLTDDQRRIPVQMKSKVLIGSITAELKKMKGTQKSNAQVKLSRN